MKRVDIRKILCNPKLRKEIIERVVGFLCALEGHNHPTKK